MIELAQSMLKLTGSPSSLEFHSLPVDDRVRCQPDITLARERLGWAPTVDLEAGMARTIVYFRDILGAPRP